MASFDTNGLDALIIDLDEISEIDDETMLDMLEAGGEVIRKAHVEAIKKIFGHRSGKFEESPTVHKKMSGQGGHLRYILVYPGWRAPHIQGARENLHQDELGKKRRPRKNWRHKEGHQSGCRFCS